MTTGAVTTIVAVDDDPIVLRSLERALHRPGFRVVVLDKPADVLFLLQSESVDILISDMDMPNMTGLELLALVRRSFPTVVRILLTGDTKIDTALRAINEGEVFRYLTKPWDLDNLLGTIDDAVARLPELRRAPLAADAARAQADLLASLEADHPGITALPAPGEPYALDRERIGALVAQMPRSLLRSFLEQQLRPTSSPPPAPPLPG